jgi:N-acetylglucosamine malate deacetylase 1
MNILVLSPHIDDGVIGCGGMMTKYQERGASITYLVLTNDSPPYPHDILNKELNDALIALGLNSKDIIYRNFPTRYFYKHRDEVLDSLFLLSNEQEYDYILTPSRFDVHQDHQVITEELLRIYKRRQVSILGYEIILNQYRFSTSFFCGLEETHIQRKITAFNCFKSQLIRPHYSSELFTSLANVRGAQMGVKYAEAFEAIRVII